MWWVDTVGHLMTLEGADAPGSVDTNEEFEKLQEEDCVGSLPESAARSPKAAGSEGTIEEFEKLQDVDMPPELEDPGF